MQRREVTGQLRDESHFKKTYMGKFVGVNQGINRSQGKVPLGGRWSDGRGESWQGSARKLQRNSLDWEARRRNIKNQRRGEVRRRRWWGHQMTIAQGRLSKGDHARRKPFKMAITGRRAEKAEFRQINWSMHPGRCSSSRGLKQTPRVILGGGWKLLRLSRG